MDNSMTEYDDAYERMKNMTFEEFVQDQLVRKALLREAAKWYRLKRLLTEE